MFFLKKGTGKRGAMAVEYGLLVGLIGVVLMGGISATGQSISDLFTRVSNTLQNANNQTGNAGAVGPSTPVATLQIVATPASPSIPENVAAGVRVAALTATNAGQTVVYSLVSDGGGRFLISGSDVIIKSGSVFNYEGSEKTIALTVKAVSGGDETTSQLTVSISDAVYQGDVMTDGSLYVSNGLYISATEDGPVLLTTAHATTFCPTRHAAGWRLPTMAELRLVRAMWAAGHLTVHSEWDYYLAEESKSAIRMADGYEQLGGLNPSTDFIWAVRCVHS